MKISKTLTFDNDVCEAVGVFIENENTVLISLYRPPDSNSIKYFECIDTIKSWLSTVCTHDTSILVSGDFNFRHLKWQVKEGCDTLQPILEPGSLRNVQLQVNETLEFVNSHYLSQIVRKASRLRSFLDLLFCNSHQFNNPSVIPVPATVSDHCLLEWSVMANTKHPHIINHPVIEDLNDLSNYDFRNPETDWQAIQVHLQKCMLERTNQSASVDEQLNWFYDECTKASHEGAKRKSTPKNFKRIPRDRKALMRQATKIKRFLNNCTNDRKIKYYRSKLVNIESKLLLSFQNERLYKENQAISKIDSDPKYFYSFANKFRTVNTCIGPLKNADGCLVQDETKMSNVLNQQYFQTFNDSIPDGHIKICLDISNDDSSQCISPEDFFDDFSAPLTRPALRQVQTNSQLYF